MKIVQIDGDSVRWVTPYKSFDEVPPFAPEIILIEAPDFVLEGFIFKDGEFFANELLPEPDEETEFISLSEIVESLQRLTEAIEEKIGIQQTIPASMIEFDDGGTLQSRFDDVILQVGEELWGDF